jgi:hypothetical protein
VPRARPEAKFRIRAGHGPVSILCTATGSLRLDGGATARRTADADLVIACRLGCSSLYACPMRRPSSVLLPCSGRSQNVRKTSACYPSSGALWANQPNHWLTNAPKSCYSSWLTPTNHWLFRTLQQRQKMFLLCPRKISMPLFILLRVEKLARKACLSREACLSRRGVVGLLPRAVRTAILGFRGRFAGVSTNTRAGTLAGETRGAS